MFILKDVLNHSEIEFACTSIKFKSKVNGESYDLPLCVFDLNELVAEGIVIDLGSMGLSERLQYAIGSQEESVFTHVKCGATVIEYGSITNTKIFLGDAPSVVNQFKELKQRLAVIKNELSRWKEEAQRTVTTDQCTTHFFANGLALTTYPGGRANTLFKGEAIYHNTEDELLVWMNRFF